MAPYPLVGHRTEDAHPEPTGVPVPFIRTEREGRVAVVTLDDPQRRNALNLDLCAELAATMDQLEADTASVRSW